MTFGQYIRKVRTAHSFSLRETARKIDISAPYLSRIERDLVPPPAEEVLEKMVELFDQEKGTLYSLAKKQPKLIEEASVSSKESFDLFYALAKADKVGQLSSLKKDMSEKTLDQVFNNFIEREDDRITPEKFFDILEEISSAKVKRTIELKAKLVEGKLEFEPTDEVVVKGNEILLGENRIVVNMF